MNYEVSQTAGTFKCHMDYKNVYVSAHLNEHLFCHWDHFQEKCRKESSSEKKKSGLNMQMFL